MTLNSHDARLLLSAVAAVGLLIFLIARWKLNAFIALILSSLFAGIAAGMPLSGIVKAFQEGVGAMLSTIAMVVGLGAVLGKLLGQSGGAEVIAQTLIRLLGPARLPWTLLLVGVIVGIPVFFTVGLVLLVPILFTLVQTTGRPVLLLGIPLVAGLSVVHGLTPPHPGPMAAIAVLHGDAGKVILYSLLFGVPAAAVAGPVFAKKFCAGITVPSASTGGKSAISPATKPSFPAALFTILLPIVLMLLASFCDVLLRPEDPARQLADFIGSPLASLAIATVVAFYTFGVARGYNKTELCQFVESSLGPVAAILLIVGAGGGFNRVLLQSGVGETVAKVATSSHLSPLLLGWFAAVLIRVATGSATVAISTAAGLLAPMALATPGINIELLIIAMGAGSLILSHVNDGGFWFVKEYLNLTVTQTLRTWTVVGTVISVVVLGEVLLVNAVSKLF